MDNLVTRAKSKLKLTDEQLAEACGVHPITVYRWEKRGKVSGPVKRVIEDMMAAKRAAQ